MLEFLKPLGRFGHKLLRHQEKVSDFLLIELNICRQLVAQNVTQSKHLAKVAPSSFWIEDDPVSRFGKQASGFNLLQVSQEVLHASDLGNHLYQTVEAANDHGKHQEFA
jgi:hypothetical protein